MLLILYVIDNYFFPLTNAFRTLSFNLLWIPIFLISGRYGTAPAVFTGLICAGYFVYASLLENFFYGEFSLSFADKLQVFSFVFFAALLGQLYDRIINSYWRLVADKEDLEDQFNNLLTHHWALQKVNVELEKRIVRRQSTMKSLYEMARNLESLEEEGLYSGVIDLCRRFVRAKSACLFVKNQDDKLVLVKHTGHEEKDFDKLQKKVQKNALVRKGCNSRTVVFFLEGYEHQAELPSDEKTLIVAPVRQETTNRLLGLITIDSAPVLSLNSGNLKILGIISDWTARALEKNAEIRRLKDEGVESPDTGVYSYNFFKTRLKEEASRFMRHHTPFSIALLKIRDFTEISVDSQEELKNTLKQIFASTIRFHDMICNYRSPGMYVIILPLSEEKETLVHISRLKNKIETEKIKPYQDEKSLEVKYYLLTIKPGQPETMYRKTPEEGAKIVIDALEEKIGKNESAI